MSHIITFFAGALFGGLIMAMISVSGGDDDE